LHRLELYSADQDHPLYRLELSNSYSNSGDQD
jgi:hypothetical protein